MGFICKDKNGDRCASPLTFIKNGYVAGIVLCNQKQFFCPIEESQGAVTNFIATGGVNYSSTLIASICKISNIDAIGGSQVGGDAIEPNPDVLPFRTKGGLSWLAFKIGT